MMGITNLGCFDDDIGIAAQIVFGQCGLHTADSSGCGNGELVSSDVAVGEDDQHRPVPGFLNGCGNHPLEGLLEPLGDFVIDVDDAVAIVFVIQLLELLQIAVDQYR